MKYTPMGLEGNVNVSPGSPLRDFFVLLSGALGLVLAIYVVLGFAVDLAVPMLPGKAEQALGRLYSVQFADEEGTEQSRRLQELLDRLSEGLPGENNGYRVHLQPAEVVNAMALPGGNIVVFSELVDGAGSENELAFVLAHELGHFANRDQLRGLGRGLVLLTMSATLLGSDSSFTEFMMDSLAGVEMKFSRDQETKADLFAVDLINRKYGHVGGAEDFFARVDLDERTGRLGRYFATHPHPDDRVRAIRQHVEKMGYRSGEKTPLKPDGEAP